MSQLNFQQKKHVWNQPHFFKIESHYVDKTSLIEIHVFILQVFGLKMYATVLYLSSYS